MPIYSPSIGDLARQYLGNEIDKSTSSIRKTGDTLYGVTGNKNIRDTTHKMIDTTGLRSNGRLPTPDAPEMSRIDAMRSGLSNSEPVRDNSGDIVGNVAGMVADYFYPGSGQFVSQAVSSDQGEDLSKGIRAEQQNSQTQQDEEWNANLKSFYPDVF